jgi:UDP-glucose 4-epimerase
MDRGKRVVIIDDLSTGVSESIPRGAAFVRACVGNRGAVREILQSYGVDEVIHLAGSAVVADSISRPHDYYGNNLVNSFNLLDECRIAGIKRFIFSSTAAVYAESSAPLLDEVRSVAPATPYGASKWMFEQVLADVAAASGMRSLALRYFNVAGADPAGRAGQSTANATHLVKVACRVALGLEAKLRIFGADHGTPDGTGVRDFVHVTDLAELHVAALDRLREGQTPGALNCGYGRGSSVLEVVRAAEAAAGRPLALEIAPRRPGDAARAVADTSRLRAVLDWRPRHDDLSVIVGSALQWERRLAGVA